MEIKRTLNRNYCCFCTHLLGQYNLRVETEFFSIISNENLNPYKLYKANNQVWLMEDEASHNVGI